MRFLLFYVSFILLYTFFQLKGNLDEMRLFIESSHGPLPDELLEENISISNSVSNVNNSNSTKKNLAATNSNTKGFKNSITNITDSDSDNYMSAG
jgi:hypothetical protein